MVNAVSSTNPNRIGAGTPDQVGVLTGAEPLAAVLSPLRRRMLQSLGAPDSASGLARRFGIPRQKINYHLRKLESAGLVELAEEKSRRGCTERLVRLTARAFVISPAFLEGLAADPDLVRDSYSSAYLVAAAARLVSEVAEFRQKAEEAGKRQATFALETEISFESPAAFNAFSSELATEMVRLAAKYNRQDVPGNRKFRIFLGAHQAAKAKPAPTDSMPAAGPLKRGRKSKTGEDK